MMVSAAHHSPSSRFLRPALILISLGGGALAFLALISRIYGFWLLPRWPRMFVLGAGALICSLFLGWALRGGWDWLASPPRARKAAWLAAAFGIGLVVKALLGWSAPAIPALYSLEIKTTGASGTVVFMELRDASGRAVNSADLVMEGNWQKSSSGWVARSDQPAGLRYTFYASRNGQLHALFAEQPGAGQVQITLNGHSQQVDLNGTALGQQLVDIPFQKTGRWETLLFAADLALWGFALPVFLFVAPFYGWYSARWAKARISPAFRMLSAHFDYQKMFLVVFFGLCLLPFMDYKGDLSTVNRFFGGNNRFWVVYSWFRYQVFHDRFLGNTLIGKDGWLILSNDHSLEDYQNAIPFTDAELLQIQQRIDGTARQLKAQGITFLVVIPPNKNTIYPEIMPQQVPVIGRESRLDQVMEYQKAHGQTQILDLRPALLQARKEHQVYFRTDTHWNAYGAYVGYAAIIRALQKDFPNLEPHPLDQYRLVPGDDLLGDLALHWVQGAPKENFAWLEPLFPRQVTKWDLFQDHMGYSLQNNENGAGLPSAIVYHDSFMDELEPFLSDHFSKAMYIRSLNYDQGLDERLIAREKPDIVIFECNERWIEKLLLLSPGHQTDQ